MLSASGEREVIDGLAPAAVVAANAAGGVAKARAGMANAVDAISLRRERDIIYSKSEFSEGQIKHTFKATYLDLYVE